MAAEIEFAPEMEGRQMSYIRAQVRREKTLVAAREQIFHRWDTLLWQNCQKCAYSDEAMLHGSSAAGLRGAMESGVWLTVRRVFDFVQLRAKEIDAKRHSPKAIRFREGLEHYADHRNS